MSTRVHRRAWRAAIGIAEDAACMVDEAKRLFDVALSVARLRVVFPDEAPQRRSNLLVGGGRRNTQRFIERGSHRFRMAADSPVAAGIFREIPPRGKRDTARSGPRRAKGARRATRRSLPNPATTKLFRRPRPDGCRLAAPVAGRDPDHSAFFSFSLCTCASFSRIRADLPERSRR